MKIKILKDVIGRVGSGSVRMKEGDEVDIPREDAMHLVNGGYAQPLGQMELPMTNAVKIVNKGAGGTKVKR